MKTERMTVKLREALKQAENYARIEDHSSIEPSHLLLSLVQDKSRIVYPLLEAMEQSPSSIEEMMIDELDRYYTSEEDVAPAMSRESQQALSDAFALADRLDDEFVSPEHLLLGISAGSGRVGKALQKLGVTWAGGIEIIARMRGAQVHKKAVVDNKLPHLERFGRNLTKLAEKGELDPLIGREEELGRLVQVLCRRIKNNPVLLGDPGVGKTAIVEGLASRIAAGDIPSALKNRLVFAIDVGALVAGTRYRGEFESRVKGLLKEVEDSEGQIITFFDEVHSLVGAGDTEGGMNAGNLFKPALARGHLRAVGATTVAEYRKYIEKDAALERRFQPILINEPTVAETTEILDGLKSSYENHHKVRITRRALRAAATLSDRYVTDRFLPDKAIDLIDEASSRIRLQADATPDIDQIDELRGSIKEAHAARDEAVAKREWSGASRLEFEEIPKLLRKLEGLKPPREEVIEDDIAEVISRWTGVPVQKLVETETEKLVHMEEAIERRLVGQSDAVASVANAIRRAHAGIADPNRPNGSFMFLGPTGVGKTELVRALAEFLFGDERTMVRIDMSEYREQHTAARLIGSPPGYVGYESGGQLTEIVRRKPYSVVLFDEVEKAHEDVLNLLLQLLDDGRLTDGHGRVVDFRNTVVVMTSNIGSEVFFKDIPEEKQKQEVFKQVQEKFRPELLNRIDDIVLFDRLEPEHIGEIVTIQLKRLEERLEDKGLSIQATDMAKRYLASRGYSPQFGARPLKRLLQREVQDELAKGMLAGDIGDGDTVTIGSDGESIHFENAS